MDIDNSPFFVEYYDCYLERFSIANTHSDMNTWISIEERNNVMKNIGDFPTVSNEELEKVVGGGTGMLVIKTWQAIIAYAYKHIK